MNAHLWTREFFSLAESHLKEEGVLAVSLTFIPPSSAQCGVGATLKSVFPYVYTRSSFYPVEKKA